MTNRLTKIIEASYIEGTPGSPGRPGQAAYNSFKWERVCKYRGLTYTWAQDSDGVWRNIPLYPANAVLGPYECGPEIVQTWNPEIQGQPTIPAGAYSVTYNFRNGWNAGASSMRFFDGHGIARFTTSPGTVGVVVGLVREGPAVSTQPFALRRYLDIEHGFYVTRTIARVVEKGVAVYYVGDVGANAVLSILRINGVVFYLVNSSVVWVSATRSAGRVFMQAVLYSGGDYVDSPSMEDVMLMGAMQCSAKENTTSEASPYTRGVTESLILTDTCTGTPAATGSMSFLPLACNGGVPGHVSKGIVQFEAL